MSPETAQRRMAEVAQSLTGGSHSITSKLATRIPRKWEFVNFKRPTTLTALYFPAWLLGGMAMLPMLFGKSRVRVAFIGNAIYFPGNDLPVLSSASLWPPELNAVQPSPFTEEFHAEQASVLGVSGSALEIVPFNITPISILRKTPVLPVSGELQKVKRDIQFASSTYANRDGQGVTQNVQELFAMPAYLPVYAASYADEGPNPGEPLVLFIQAHNEQGIIHTSKHHVSTLGKKNGAEPHPQQHASGREIVSFLGSNPRLQQYAVVRRGNEGFTDKESSSFQAYFNKLLGSPAFISELAAETAGARVNFNHPLVRELTTYNIDVQELWYMTNLEKIVEQMTLEDKE
ncbi:hypothetical protein CPC08DRAFT_819875 [Agrocybe pediades]|nr:hypothetical protein CPC08DRAFT_819875 [Agrocybe pediades]